MSSNDNSLISQDLSSPELGLIYENLLFFDIFSMENNNTLWNNLRIYIRKINSYGGWKFFSVQTATIYKIFPCVFPDELMSCEVDNA